MKLANIRLFSDRISMGSKKSLIYYPLNQSVKLSTCHFPIASIKHVNIVRRLPLQISPAGGGNSTGPIHIKLCSTCLGKSGSTPETLNCGGVPAWQSWEWAWRPNGGRIGGGDRSTYIIPQISFSTYAWLLTQNNFRKFATIQDTPVVHMRIITSANYIERISMKPNARVHNIITKYLWK